VSPAGLIDVLRYRQMRCNREMPTIMGRLPHDDRERSVTNIASIEVSIDHSPWQINDLFIVLFKRILDPRV
jgi:hypothetical protein